MGKGKLVSEFGNLGIVALLGNAYTEIAKKDWTYNQILKPTGLLFHW
jgi:hypothetical protein